MLFEDKDLRKKINEKRAQMKEQSNGQKSVTSTSTANPDRDQSSSSSSGKNNNLIIVTSPSDTTVYKQAIKPKTKAAKARVVVRNTSSLGTIHEQGELDLEEPGGVSPSGASNLSGFISDSDSSSSSETDSDSSSEDECRRKRAKR